MPPSFASWLSAASLAVLSIVGFVVFANTRIHLPSSNSALASHNTTVVEVVSFTNATQLAQVCASACLGGACEQSEITGITSCLSCGSGATIDSVTRMCVDTSDCVLWPWCSIVEGGQARAVHNALALKAFFGPYAMNYTYPFPVARYGELQEFVPRLAATQTAVAVLLNTYVSGRLALGGGDANTAVYFIDEGGFWGNSLTLYKGAVPGLYISYIQTLKQKLCTRTWQPSQGSCGVP